MVCVMLQNAKLWFITLWFSCRNIIMSVLPPVRKDRIIGQLPKVHVLHTMHWCQCLFWNSSSGPFPQVLPEVMSVNVHSCCSASTKALLWTQRMNSTARWRRPVSSRGQELWGEKLSFVLLNQWFMQFCFILCFLSSRFKISKVIVVGDLAVGKTCLINRWAKLQNELITSKQSACF